MAGVAYLNAILHVAAALAILFLLQPGLAVDGSTVEGRRLYVVAHPVAWTIGWLIWHASAISLLGLYVALAETWREQAPLRCGVALLCASGGLAADLTSQAILIGVAPKQDIGGFVLLEQVASFVTAYLGNGLYTLAGILLTWAGGHDLPRPVLLLSLPVWAAGIGLSVATVLAAPTGQFLSTALLVPAIVLWSLAVGRWLDSRRHHAASRA
jgi:hypothetical protein